MTDNTRALLEQALESMCWAARVLNIDSDEAPNYHRNLEAIRAELAKPARRALQAEGTHPAPCARHCEAVAFQNEIRALKAERDELLAALKELLSELEYGHACPLTKEKSRAAIAKAEGIVK